MDPQQMADKRCAVNAPCTICSTAFRPRRRSPSFARAVPKPCCYLSEQHPEILLPHWAHFTKLLRSDNGFSKYVAIHVIANLVTAGDEGRFEKTFNTFYKLLDDESVMVASHVAGVSGQIAKANPALQSKITRRLLDIDRRTSPPIDRH